MSEMKLQAEYEALSDDDRDILYKCLFDGGGFDRGKIQSFLKEKRISNAKKCIYCGKEHVVKNGMRKDGTQRYLCRDCKKSFIPSSESVMSRSRKGISVWVDYLNCMIEQKTLTESAEVCGLSVSTSFAWRHKILDAVREKLKQAEFDDKEIHNDTSEQSPPSFSSSFRRFIIKFRGVSSKHLQGYIAWDNFFSLFHKKRRDLLIRLLEIILCSRLTLYNKDISNRAVRVT